MAEPVRISIGTEEGELSETRLRIAFEGPDVERGDIDVRDLAPALVALGQLFQAAAKVLNGERAQTQVRLQEVNPGSFIADLSIIQSVGEMLRELFDFSSAHKDGIEAADGLVDLIFKVGGPAADLFLLLKTLKGKKPEKVERSPSGDISITAADGATIIINSQVEKLYADPQVRKAAQRVAEAAEAPGIERLKLICEETSDGPPLLIEKGEAAAFALPPSPEEPEPVGDEERILLLQLRKVWLADEGKTNKWDFTEGDESFTAAVEDAAFLNKVATGEISFNVNDYMKARVRVRQTMTNKGLKAERRILEVLEYKSGSRQLQLL